MGRRFPGCFPKPGLSWSWPTVYPADSPGQGLFGGRVRFFPDPVSAPRPRSPCRRRSGRADDPHAIKFAQPATRSILNQQGLSRLRGILRQEGRARQTHHPRRTWRDPRRLGSARFRPVARGFARPLCRRRIAPQSQRCRDWSLVLSLRREDAVDGPHLEGAQRSSQAAEDLQPGEWDLREGSLARKATVEADLRELLHQARAGQVLADAKIAVPVRSAGVQFSGDNAHLVIRTSPRPSLPTTASTSTATVATSSSRTSARSSAATTVSAPTNRPSIASMASPASATAPGSVTPARHRRATGTCSSRIASPSISTFSTRADTP